MRILFLMRMFPVVSETFILNQITGLLELGHDVQVLAWSPPPKQPRHPDFLRHDLRRRTHYLWPGTTLRRVPALAAMARDTARQAFADPGRRRLLAQLVQAEREQRGGWPLLPYGLRALELPPFDVVCAHYGPAGLLSSRLRRLGCLKGKLVTVFHGYDVSQFVTEHGEHVYDELFGSADLLLPVSRVWAERLESLGADPSKVEVHHMGVDCTRIGYVPRRPPAGGVTHIVSIGRLVEKKGFVYALEALARLKAAGAHDFRYHLVGDGEGRAHLEDEVERLQLREVVTFHGYKRQNEIRAMLPEMHIALAPSVTAADGDAEGIPVSLMEAMASGMPVVSTRHSGIGELVEPGTSGWLAAERDVDGLAAHLRRLLDEPARWEPMGRAGRARVEAEFDVRALNRRLAERFAALLPGGANSRRP